MARRRYQKGSLCLRGKREKVWVARWREDEIRDGKPVRVPKKETLGTLKDYPTKRLAQRALDEKLAPINSPGYRARPTATIREFADRWAKKVLPNHKPSSQPSAKSELAAWTAAIGTIQLKDVTAECLQAVMTGWQKDRSPKTIRNRVATFRLLWSTALAWGYVSHKPCEGLVRPDWDKPEQPTFAADDVRRIVTAAEPPYDAVYWLVFETGIRRGELCALNVGHVDLKHRVIVVRHSRWGKHITENKSRKPRVFSLSPQLAERLRAFVDGRQPDEPLFVTPRQQTTKKKKWVGGTRLHPDNLVKRKLKPLLDRLGLSGAMHAFRHGNATALDRMNAPMKVRQGRLGHVDQRTTLDYTHLVGEDDRQTSAELGNLIGPFCAQVAPNIKNGFRAATGNRVISAS